MQPEMPVERAARRRRRRASGSRSSGAPRNRPARHRARRRLSPSTAPRSMTTTSRCGAAVGAAPPRSAAGSGEQRRAAPPSPEKIAPVHRRSPYPLAMKSGLPRISAACKPARRGLRTVAHRLVAEHAGARAICCERRRVERRRRLGCALGRRRRRLQAGAPSRSAADLLPRATAAAFLSGSAPTPSAGREADAQRRRVGAEPGILGVLVAVRASGSDRAARRAAPSCRAAAAGC